MENANQGSAPVFFGCGNFIHDRIREKMFSIYCEEPDIPYLDEQAKSLYLEGLKFFRELKNSKDYILESNTGICEIITWKGDKITRTITLLLVNAGLKAIPGAGYIRVTSCNLYKLRMILKKIYDSGKPDFSFLAEIAPISMEYKYDEYVPENLLRLDYYSRYIDCDGAWAWLSEVFSTA